MVRLLHISDLHFRAKDSWDADPVRNALIEDAFALRGERGAVDLIVVTGGKAEDGSRPYLWSRRVHRTQDAHRSVT